MGTLRNEGYSLPQIGSKLMVSKMSMFNVIKINYESGVLTNKKCLDKNIIL